MGFLSRLFPSLAPRVVNPPAALRSFQQPIIPNAQASSTPRQVAANPVTYFEALRNSTDRTPIPAGELKFRSSMRGLNRQALAAIGDYLYDNNGAVSYAVNTIANYSVPITPQAASVNPEWNKLANAYWFAWCKRADFTGRFHFNTLQRIICKSVDIHGDIGVIPTVENGFVQVQLVDGWRIGAAKSAEPFVIDGVRIDRKGRVLGYQVGDYVDEMKSPTVKKAFEFVTANEMRLIYDPDRFSSYRGITPIRRGSNDIRDAQDIKAFEKLAVKVGASLSAVLEQGGVLEEDVWGNDSGNGTTVDGSTLLNDPASPPTKQEKKLSMAELLGGDIPVLEDGQKLNQLSNNRPGTGVVEFMLALTGCFVQGLDLPPAFFLDEKLTGPNQRAVNGKAQRCFDRKQEMMAGLVEWLWPRVIGAAIENVELPSQEGFEVIEWQGPASVSIDAGREMAQEREDVASGLMTRQEHFGKRSLNWKRETMQGLSELEFIIDEANRIAKEKVVPVGVILERFGVGSAKDVAPEPEEKVDPKKADPKKEEPK